MVKSCWWAAYAFPGFFSWKPTPLKLSRMLLRMAHHRQVSMLYNSPSHMALLILFKAFRFRQKGNIRSYHLFSHWKEIGEVDISAENFIVTGYLPSIFPINGDYPPAGALRRFAGLVSTRSQLGVLNIFPLYSLLYDARNLSIIPLTSIKADWCLPEHTSSQPDTYNNKI